MKSSSSDTWKLVGSPASPRVCCHVRMLFMDLDIFQNDRGCLNCKRMAQEDPECPCECSIGENWGSDDTQCGSDLLPSADIRDLDLCPAWFRAQDTLLPNFSTLQDTLLPCSEANCPAKSNPSDCYGERCNKLMVSIAARSSAAR